MSAFDPINKVGTPELNPEANNNIESKETVIGFDSHVSNSLIHVSVQDRKRWDEAQKLAYNYTNYQFINIIGKFAFDVYSGLDEEQSSYSNDYTICQILSGEIGNRINAIRREKSARIAADDSEAAARLKADREEANARKSADMELTTRLSTEEETRATEIQELREQLEEMQTSTAEAVSNMFVNGMIIAFSGTEVPSGWLICDGTNDTPNLTDRFIIGASAEIGSYLEQAVITELTTPKTVKGTYDLSAVKLMYIMKSDAAGSEEGEGGEGGEEGGEGGEGGDDEGGDDPTIE